MSKIKKGTTMAQYTYFDICKALFGANTDAFGIEAIHDFIIEELKNRRPLCAVYGDYNIQIAGSFNSVIEDLRREFNKKYIEVNQVYATIEEVMKNNFNIYASVVDRIVRSGDTRNILYITTTKRWNKNRECFIRTDSLPECIAYICLKKQQAKTEERTKTKIVVEQDGGPGKTVIKVAIPYLIEMMQKKCKLQPDTIYGEYVKKYLGKFVAQDASSLGKKIFLQRGYVVYANGSVMEDGIEYATSLVNRLLDTIHKDYLSVFDIYKKMNSMPVFSCVFPFYEVRDKLLTSSAFEHCGMSEIGPDLKREIYLLATEFEAFLEDEYPDLWEEYLHRKNPWLSVEALTRLVNLSVDTITEILEDMAQKPVYADLVRYEKRDGKEYPFLNPNYTAVFSDYAKRYVKQRDAKKKKVAPQDNSAKELEIPFDEETVVKEEIVPVKRPVKKEQKTFVPVSINSGRKNHFYVNGANRPYLPDVRLLNPNINASNLYLNPDDLHELFVPDYLANSRKKGVSVIITKQETMLNIIKLLVRNTRTYHEEKARDEDIRDIRMIQRCEKILRCEAQTLERDAEFIQKQFHVNILPLVALYKQGVIPALEQVFGFFYQNPSNVVYFAKQIGAIIR